ncbi:hypothetical protein [Aquibacillus halophilus]|nr:hypothetical protein [Aquibacillus halophilus]
MAKTVPTSLSAERALWYSFCHRELLDKKIDLCCFVDDSNLEGQ